MTVTKKILLGTLAFMAFAWISNASYQDEIIAENHYCSMVARFINSDGESGWPNFKQLDCKRGTEDESRNGK
tara:strand:+ start:373 stop:588 length:216 start_codon:yes stop_codon:yes gene_type:complete